VTLTHSDFEKLHEKIRLAYQTNDLFLNRFQQYAKRLKHDVKPLRNFSANAISFTSIVGGNYRVVFNPAVLDLVRVLDSHGKEDVIFPRICGHGEKTNYLFHHMSKTREELV